MMLIRETHIRKLVLLSIACFWCVLGSARGGKSHLSANELKYTQNSVNAVFSDGKTLAFTFDQITKQLTAGDHDSKSIVKAIQTIMGQPAARIDIVKLEDDYYSINNRRLHLYKMLSAKYEQDLMLPMGEMLTLKGEHNKTKPMHGDLQIAIGRKNFKPFGKEYAHPFTANPNEDIVLKGPEKIAAELEELCASFGKETDVTVKETMPEQLPGPKAEPSMSFADFVNSMMRKPIAVSSSTKKCNAPSMTDGSPSLGSDGGSSGTTETLSEMSLASKGSTPSTETSSGSGSPVKPIPSDEDSSSDAQVQAKKKTEKKYGKNSDDSSSSSSYGDSDAGGDETANANNACWGGAESFLR